MLQARKARLVWRCGEQSSPGRAHIAPRMGDAIPIRPVYPWRHKLLCLWRADARLSSFQGEARLAALWACSRHVGCQSRLRGLGLALARAKPSRSRTQPFKARSGNGAASSRLRRPRPTGVLLTYKFPSSAALRSVWRCTRLSRVGRAHVTSVAATDWAGAMAGLYPASGATARPRDSPRLASARCIASRTVL